MSSLNRVTLIGHLGGDPEQRTTQAGDPVVTFSLATSQNWKDQASGEKRERTEWHRVVVFNTGLVKIAAEFLKKGSKALIEGELRTRKWANADGKEQSTTEVVLPAYGGQILLLDRLDRPSSS